VGREVWRGWSLWGGKGERGAEVEVEGGGGGREDIEEEGW